MASLPSASSRGHAANAPVGRRSSGVPEWTLGDRLRKAREVAGLSQQQLATELGVARRTISAYEVGERTPRAVVVRAWAIRCSVPENWLLGSSG